MKLNTSVWIFGAIVVLAISFFIHRTPSNASDPLTDASYRQSALPESLDGRLSAVPMPVLKALPQGGAPQRLFRIADSRLDEIRARSRTAMGFGRLEQLSNGLLLEGEARMSRGVGQFSLMFNPKGYYLQEVVGPLNVALGYDGKAGWVLASTQGPAEVEIEDLTIPQVVTWVQAGRWLLEEGPFEVSVAAGQQGLYPTALDLKLKADGTQARLELDARSWLPRSVAWDTRGRKEQWLLEQWTAVEGVSLPHRLVRDRGNERAEFQVQSAARAPAMAGNPYSPLQSRLAEIRARRDGRAQAAPKPATLSPVACRPLPPPEHLPARS